MSFSSTQRTLVEKFALLFSGRQDARGGVEGVCIKEKVTTEHFTRHVEGKESLGIYPLLDNGTIRWGAIDIDYESFNDAMSVINRMYEIGFNKGVYLEKSKSKGYHVFIFLSDWVSALSIRRIMASVVCLAGLPNSTEIFPKQDYLNGIRFGNYLNLPYFGGGAREGRRMIINLKTWQPIPLIAWLNQVQVFPAKSLELVTENIPENTIKAIQKETLVQSGLLTRPLHSGERRPTLIKLAGYLRHRQVSEEVLTIRF